MKYTVNVTQRDIDRARKSGLSDICVTCPVARAAKRLKVSQGIAAIGYSYLRLGPVNKYNAYLKVRVPQKVTKFILDFDHGMEVLPFKFQIEVPENV